MSKLKSTTLVQNNMLTATYIHCKYSTFKKIKKIDLNQKNRFKSKKSDFFDFLKKIMIFINPDRGHGSMLSL
jgi:predicted ATPase